MAGIKRIYISYSSQGVIVSADVESKSRKNLIHYTRIIIDPETRGIKRMSCSCEGFVFHKRCWHISKLIEIINKDENVKRKIEELATVL